MGAIDATGFVGAVLGFRDAWANYDRHDQNSQIALVGASLSLSAAIATLSSETQR
jgi:hypothetical protein